MIGEGIGIEVTGQLLRGVRLDGRATERLVAVAEVPLAADHDDDAWFDGLLRLHAQLGQARVTTRIALFDAVSTIQRIDVTGRTGPELNAVRHELATGSDVTSTMLAEVHTRRWMLAVRWDHAVATRWELLAERAGFAEVSAEPAPAALGRVLPPDTTVARRDGSPGRSWAAIYEEGVPLAAASVGQAGREPPQLATAEHVDGLHRFDALLDAAELGETVAELTAFALRRAAGGALASDVVAPGAPYPPFADHDLRAARRVAVALGAAVGAAGLAGRLRPVDVLAPAVADEVAHRPWAVELVAGPG